VEQKSGSLEKSKEPEMSKFSEIFYVEALKATKKTKKKYLTDFGNYFAGFTFELNFEPGFFFSKLYTLAIFTE